MLTTERFSSIFELFLSILTGKPIVNLLLLFVFLLKGKFRWLSEELKARLSTERRLKEQADWSQKRIRVCIASGQKHNAQGNPSNLLVTHSVPRD